MNYNTKMFFLKNIMKEDFKGAFKGALEYIPVLLALGIITGCGFQTTLFGAIVISLVFCFVNIKLPYIFAPSILFVLFLSGANACLGGSYEGLFSLLFFTSIFTIIISLFIKRKTVYKIPNSIYKGFLSGIISSGFILSLSLIFGHKMFSSIAAIQYSSTGFFEFVNLNSIVAAVTTLVLYYYLKKIKEGYFPSSFIAVVGATFISCFYKLDLPSINTGLRILKPISNENIFDGIYLILLSIICAYILSYQLLLTIKASRKNSSVKKILLFSGLSNLLSSLFGFISGSISPSATKDGHFAGSKTNYCNLFSTALFLIFGFLCVRFADYIPMSAVSAILFIKCYEILKNLILSEKKKSVKSKIIYVLSFLTCLYNIILGAALVGITSIFQGNKQNGKEN